MTITDHARAEADRVIDHLRGRTGVELTSDEVLESPHLFIGSIDGLVEKLVGLRERLGISSVMLGEVDELAPDRGAPRRAVIEGRRHERGRTSTEDPRRTAVADLGDPRHPLGVNRPARDPEDSLWRADRRALTLGLVLTITLVGFEALAISTVMPIVADELGGLELYGWVFSAFFLGSLIGIVVVGGAIDRGGLAVPFAVGLGLFAIGLLAGGLAPTMPFLVGRPLRPGPRRRHAPADRLRRHRPDSARAPAAADVRGALDGLGPARRHRPGDRRHGRRASGWRYVFLGLLPLIALAGALTLGALRDVADAPPVADDRPRAPAAAACRWPSRSRSGPAS